MWILKNSSPKFNHITNIKSIDFSTLYTTIPHQKLKSRLASVIRNSFLHKNGKRRYKYLILGREGPYFVQEHAYSKSKYTKEDMIKMLEFLVDNVFVVFAGKVFPRDNRHFHGHKLCPSPSLHIPVLIRIGIHTVLALGP